MAGYLANRIFTDSTSNWGVDSLALWSLNDPAAYTYASSQGIGNEVESLLETAYAAKDTVSDLTIYTPIPSYAGQEFLLTSTQTPEPNPASLTFLGGALICAGLVRRRRAP